MLNRVPRMGKGLGSELFRKVLFLVALNSVYFLQHCWSQGAGFDIPVRMRRA